MNPLLFDLQNPWVVMHPWAATLILILGFWTIPWKGWALWKAARASNKIWFIVLLLVNTAGILDILYIYVFCKDKKIKIESSVQQ